MDSIIGHESGLRSVFERSRLVAKSDVPVLILGETGSGKEIFARYIHEQSRRVKLPFLKVNCGAVPSDLIDSYLFGHERGAFTGAFERRKGWFESANGGTLLLDEIGELPLAAQVRFLRVLQDGSFETVGGGKTIQVDVRIIAATHRNLRQMVNEGLFREDLWYRVSVFPIRIPPLRERKEDLAELAFYFAKRATIKFGLPEINIKREDIDVLRIYDWPGNVRELGAVIDRAVLLGEGRRLAIAESLHELGLDGDVNFDPVVITQSKNADGQDVDRFNKIAEEYNKSNKSNKSKNKITIKNNNADLGKYNIDGNGIDDGIDDGIGNSIDDDVDEQKNLSQKNKRKNSKRKKTIQQQNQIDPVIPNQLSVNPDSNLNQTEIVEISDKQSDVQNETAFDNFLSLEDATRRHIEAALELTDGIIEGHNGTASLLKINPHTLRAKMRRLGIDWSKYRKA
ncbi:MAG: sigma 54-interacting transcriptional regulator [Planctomycetaceae bacterium]|jgi:transcriptional regulator with GAF, ATPase, and Fis domain|nr:sigma 54-interacting transcriptional regulator [Planctomycetaceae bacterium]